MRLTLAAVLVLSATTAMADTPDSALCHSSETIQIHGSAGQYLYGHFTITKPKGAKRIVQFEAFPDVTSGRRSIGGGMVTIAPQTAVADDTRLTFMITIMPVNDPGEYCGPLRVYDETVPEPEIYPLHVRVEPVVTHTPSVPNAAAGPHLVKCFGTIDCYLAKCLLSRKELSNSFDTFGTVQSRNAGAVLNAIPVGMSATGTTNFRTVGIGLVVPGRGQYKRETGVWTIPATFRLEQIEPDQYSGTLYMTVSGTPEPIAVPVTFAVRAGPLCVLILLLVGFFIAWLIQWIDTKGQPQIELLRRAERIPRSLSPADATLLSEQLEEFRKKAYRFDLGAAEEQLNEIEGRVRVLHHLRRLETRLQRVPDAGAIRTKIDRARNEIRHGFEDRAKKFVEEIEEALNAALEPGATEQIGSDLRKEVKGRLGRLKSRAEMLGAPFKDRFVRGREDLRDWYFEVRTNTFRFLIRPLVFTLLVLLLLWAGLYTLWIRNPAFGSSVADYISVLTWGMGANVATKTLGSLQAMVTR